MSKIIQIDKKVKCLKKGHIGNGVTFVCLNKSCRLDKIGCPYCQSDHDEHAMDILNIDDFFQQIENKDSNLHELYNDLLNIDVMNQEKAIQQQIIQQRLNQLKQVFQEHTEKYFEYINEKISQKLVSYQLNFDINIRSKLDQISDYRGRPFSQLGNKDFTILTQYKEDKQAQELINQQNQIKYSTLVQIGQDVEQSLDQLELKLNKMFRDIMISDQNQSKLKTEGKNQVTNPSSPAFLLGYPFQNQKNQKSRQFRQTSQTKRQNSFHIKTSQNTVPMILSNFNSSNQFDENKKKKAIAQKQNKILFNQSLMQGEVPIEQQNLLSQLLTTQYLNEYLQDFKPIIPSLENATFVDFKARMVIVRENPQLFYLLWDNWIMDWFSQVIKKPPVPLKIAELQDDFHHLTSTIEQDLQQDGCTYWLIKQKIKFPHDHYLTYLLVAWGDENNFKRNQGLTFKNCQTRIYQFLPVTKIHLYGKSYQSKQYNDPGISLTYFKHLRMNYANNIKEDNLTIILKGQVDVSESYKGFEQRVAFILTLAYETQRNAPQILQIFERLTVEYGQFLTVMNANLNAYSK